MVTQQQIVELQKRCVAIAESGRAFFAKAGNDFPGYAHALPAGTFAQTETLKAEIRNLTARLIEAGKFSPLIGREDNNDATTALKIAVAALRFKDYQSWDTHVLHDEDIVLGVRQAGQVEVDTDVGTALRRFDEAMLKLTDFAALLVPGQSATMLGEDDRFARMAIEEARMSVAEKDGRPHPLVGAVVVKNGEVLATSHRGEAEGNHAEFIALEKRLPDAAVAGATIYTTLEPCTTRNHPKIPCVERLIERKVKRVVIGMLDPDPRITGRGQRRLRNANIVTDFFSHELMTEVEELNREFTRTFEAAKAVTAATVSARPSIKVSGRWEGWSYRSLTQEWRPSAHEYVQNGVEIVANAWGPQNWSRGECVSIVSDGATHEIIWSYVTKNTDVGGSPGDAHSGTHFLRYSERDGHKFLEGKYITDRIRQDGTFGAGGYHRLVWVQAELKSALDFNEVTWGMRKPTDRP